MVPPHRIDRRGSIAFLSAIAVIVLVALGSAARWTRSAYRT